MNLIKRLLKRKKKTVKSETMSFSYYGKNAFIRSNCSFYGEERISIGDNTKIGENSVIYALAPITIGRYVLISPNVTIISGEHRTDLIGEFMGAINNDERLPENDSPIVIEDDVWIGANVIVLKGVTIGRGSVIHAGQIVTKSIKPYTVYISDKIQIARFTNEEIKIHEAMMREKYGIDY